MRITSTAITYYVEHSGRKYRTTNGESWECAYGESWEQEYSQEQELSKEFDRAWPDYCTRWHTMMIVLEKLYDRFNTEGTCQDEIDKIVTELLGAYDRWLD